MLRLIGLVAALVSWTAAAAPYGEVRRFTGHTAVVDAVAFAPDEKVVASGAADNTVRLWDVATGKELRKLEGHTDMPTAVQFSADGTRLFTAGMDGQARVWDAKAGDLLAVLKKRNGRHVHSAALSPDGKRALLGSCDGTVELWDVDGEKVLRAWDFPTQVDALAISPDGRRFAAGCRGERAGGGRGPDGKIHVAKLNAALRVYDLGTGALVKAFDDRAASGVQFSADGRIMAFLEDGVIWRVDAATLAVLGPFRVPERQGDFVDSFALSADGKRATGCLGRDAYYLDLEANRVLYTFVPTPKFALATAISPGGRWAVSAGGGTSRTVTVPGVRREPGPTDVMLYDLTALADRPTYAARKTPDDRLATVRFTPDDAALMTMSAKGVLATWDVATGREVGRTEVSADSGPRVAPADSGRQLFRVGDRAIEWYDMAAGGKRLADVPRPKRYVTCVLPAPGGKSALVGGYEPQAPRRVPRADLRVDLIDLPSGARLRSFEGMEVTTVRLALSADGGVLLALSGEGDDAMPTMVAWDFASGKLLWRHRSEQKATRGPAVAVSKGGLVAVAWTEVARVLDLKDGRVVATLDRIPKAGVSITFDPDGRHVWTSGGDDAVRVWEVGSGRLARTIEIGFEGWLDNRVVFRNGKAILFGCSADRVDEVPLGD